jgi:hypothetical protein
MNRQTDIANELMQIAPGINWPADVPLTVPAGYFEQLPAAILLQIQLEQLRTAPEQTQSVPSGYFEELPLAILQRIKAETTSHENVQSELAALSPFLAAIPREVPFTVPDDYFERLQVNVTQPVNPLKVVHRKRAAAWIKWTVAACLTAFVGSTAILFIANNNNHSNIEKQLEDLNDQDIVNYLQTHTDSFDNDAFFATSMETTPVQNQLNEAVPLDAIEKYLQQTDLSKEVIPEKK